MRTPLQVAEEQAREVGMHPLITRDELVGESKARHEATLLEPEDRGERTREEDTLHGGERNETLCKSRVLVGYPAKGPVRLLLDAGDRLDGVEEVLALGGVLDVSVDEERVGLGVNVLPVRENVSTRNKSGKRTLTS